MALRNLFKLISRSKFKIQKRLSLRTSNNAPSTLPWYSRMPKHCFTAISSFRPRRMPFSTVPSLMQRSPELKFTLRNLIIALSTTWCSPIAKTTLSHVVRLNHLLRGIISYKSTFPSPGLSRRANRASRKRRASILIISCIGV